jgi:hypothetical protein
MSFCQAGEERFLRVVSLVGERAEVALSTKLESCHQSLELAKPISWNAKHTLDVAWLEPHSALNVLELSPHRPHRADRSVAAAGNCLGRACAFLIGLAAAHDGFEPLGHKRQVRAVESDELGAPKTTGEAERNQRTISQGRGLI